MITISRIVAALLLGLVGYQVGTSAGLEEVWPDYVERTSRYVALIFTGVVAGWVIGGLLGKLLERAMADVRDSLRDRSGAELVVGAFGLVVGLLVSFLLSLPVMRLELVGIYLMLPLTLIISYMFAEMGALKHGEILRLLGIRAEGMGTGAPGKLLDTSVLIDARIADIARSGFLDGELVVPVFVLEELQKVADSSDDQRRARGRRGLDVVQKLRKERLVTTPGDDFPDIDGVDSKLVHLASKEGFAIVTTDFNLDKVARIQQVRVLNVNELANALKPEFVVGDQFKLKIVREGKEAGQGVGYLDDGTMVIVDRGGHVVGTDSLVEVTSVLQSPTGKLVFTRLVEAAATATNSN
jgi:uncharacterized protein YacL